MNNNENKTTIIHFVRHGEVYNPDQLRYGRLPGFHLSEKGREEVEQVSLSFVGRPIKHIYASALDRTQQTATLLGLAFPHVNIDLDPRLLEVKTSDYYEGQSRSRGFEYPNQSSEEAETIEDIKNRIFHFIEEKLIAHHGQEIVAVSHGDPIAIIYHWLVYHILEVDRNFYPALSSRISFVFIGLKLKSVWYDDIGLAPTATVVWTQPYSHPNLA